MRYLRTILAFFFLVALASCEKKVNEEGNKDFGNLRVPLKLTEKGAEIMSASTTFTFDFIHRVALTEEDDFIVSPLSMQFLLGMLMNGAQERTLEEIISVLGYGKLGIDEVNDFFMSVLQQLPNLDKKTKLSIANALFVNQSYTLFDDYQERMLEYFGADVSILDFSDATSLSQINSWCLKKTNGLIQKVFNDLNPSACSYLLNAMCFNSPWLNPFDKSLTKDETFTRENGRTIKASMMKQVMETRYHENECFSAVWLPYGNGSFSMIVLLPIGGKTVLDISEYLKVSGLSWSVGREGTYEVDIWLPRFELQYDKVMSGILSEMGMPSAFNLATADFTAMSQKEFCLENILQKAIIKVDEESTEIAVISYTDLYDDPPPSQRTAIFHADHPFLFLITETSTGAVLFAGRYSGNSRI